MTHVLLSTVQPVKASIAGVRSQLNVLLHCVMLTETRKFVCNEGVNPGHNMVESLLNGTRQHFCTDCHASVKFVIK